MKVMCVEAMNHGIHNFFEVGKIYNVSKGILLDENEWAWKNDGKGFVSARQINDYFNKCKKHEKNQCVYYAQFKEVL